MKIEIKFEEVWSDNKWLPKSLTKTNCFKDFTYRYKIHIVFTYDKVFDKIANHAVLKSSCLQEFKYKFLILRAYTYQCKAASNNPIMAPMTGDDEIAFAINTILLRLTDSLLEIVDNMQDLINVNSLEFEFPQLS